MTRRVGVAVMVTVALAACGGGDDSSAPTSGASGSSTTERPTTTPAPTTVRRSTTTSTAAGEIPEWAPPGWTSDDVDRLTQLLSEAMAAAGLAVDIDAAEGVGRLGDGRVVGLVNLAQTLADLQPDEWPTAIGEHVTGLQESMRDVTAMPYEEAAPMLRIRVGESDAIVTEGMVGQQLAGDLFALVVVDQPRSVSYVPTAATETWGVSATDLYDIAVAQTIAQPVTPERIGTGEVAVFGDIYSASWILDPSQVLEDVGATGAVIAIPNATFLIAVPVEGIDIETIIRLAILSKQDYANESNPASDDLYWWHEGTLELIESREGSVQLPPGLDAIVTG